MTLLRKLVPRLLPPPLLYWAKRTYYVRAVQSFWEPDTEPIKYLVRPGDLVLDIGANVGDYTRIFAQLVGRCGRVYSIEPIPDTFELLSAVVRKLQLENVHLINCAISAKDGRALMEIPLHEYGTQNFYQAKIVPEGKGSRLRQYAVPLRSLDSLFLEMAPEISFIKCDVEGHELSVIKGASKLLAESKPAWLIEISKDPDDKSSSSHQLFSYLHDHNYSAYWFDGQVLKRRSPGDRAINYFFLQPSQTLQLAGLLGDRQGGPDDRRDGKRAGGR